MELLTACSSHVSVTNHIGEMIGLNKNSASSRVFFFLELYFYFLSKTLSKTLNKEAIEE